MDDRDRNTEPGLDPDGPEYGENGALLGLCTEELQLKSELLEAVQDGVVANTPAGELIYFNEPICRLMGYTPAEFAELGPWGWMPKAAPEKIADRMSLLRERGWLVFETRGFTRSGARFNGEVHARVIQLPGLGEVIISAVRDITERLAAQETMRHLAFHDTLTGLANRIMLDERMEYALSDADRHGDIVGIVYMDLDKFKPVNDRLGHATGDRVLRIVAERLLSCVRESDTVARMGGDEFVALFPRLGDGADLAAKARRIAECVAAPITIDGEIVQVSISAGLATYRPGEATDELLSRADQAMYQAKVTRVEGWKTFSSA